MSKFTIKLKTVIYDDIEVEAENTLNAIEKAKKEIKEQYSLIGDETVVLEIEEDFI